ncbi:PIN-like domain-containing protein [Actinoplanes sp. TFC3]|uniref:PIN-like domain-containing protein n=1 Tax=Actinoplanes sp. TFC3 TaxID=1710355 RepID=UPI0012905112|nr:PIN-like domain-containing protein [Actinoplanes sp. TFC3]
MSNSRLDDINKLGLAQSFRAWAELDPDPAPFLQSGLIALDANALLHLYRVTPQAREQILATLGRIQDRLWIPHQAALEFHRNRLNAVVGKMHQFGVTRQTLSQAPAKAIAEVRKAISQLVDFREYNMTERTWNPEAHGLDEASILKRLEGLIDPALAELKILQAEHDISPRDIVRTDHVLQHLESITKGRIGQPYDLSRLMKLVREAIDFRFPNEIPPGYKDAAKKPTDYGAAGDYILWRQVLDRVAQDPGIRMVALVTNDVKADWWVHDKHGEPEQSRPELRQELLELTGAELSLLTLSSFLEAAAQQFPGSVTEETVQAVRSSEANDVIRELLETLDSEIEQATDSGDLLALSISTLEYLVRKLLQAMGYQNVEPAPNHRNLGYDIVALHPHSNIGNGKTLVEVKRYARGIGVDAVRALFGAMQHEHAEHGMLVCTSNFFPSAREFAQGKNISLIDDRDLLGLLSEYLDLGGNPRPPRESD